MGLADLSEVYNTVYCVQYTTPPWGRISKFDCSTTTRVPTPKYSSSDGYRRGASNADLFCTDTIPAAVEISSTENRPGGE